MSSAPVIYRAKRIVTLDHAMPLADAVAVHEGRILHTGSFAEVSSDLAGWHPQVDDRFADAVLIPGFIEAHSHIFSEAALAITPWVGSYDRRKVGGGFQAGCRTIDDVLARLREADRELDDPHTTLIAMGWDPSMAGGATLTGAHLEEVSHRRPIFVIHTSLHIGVGNDAMMELAGITASTDVEGVMRHGDGTPNGELRENALSLVFGTHVKVGGRDSLVPAGDVARMVGCTTVTDLAATIFEPAYEAQSAVVQEDSFAARVVYAPNIRSMRARLGDDLLPYLQSLQQKNSDKFRMGPVKFLMDGSIQGRTARMNWPGYCCGEPNGVWIWDREELRDAMLPFHRAGMQIAMHANGDEAIDAALDLFEDLLSTSPRPDHRHRLEHVQLASESAFRRMKALGLSVNLFANHVYYWGETHRRETAGPARARTLDACGTAQRLGVPYSIHSDAPVTPLDPLFSMWCAVNRLTSEGRVLGESEKISPIDALRAVTINAAYLLKLDHLTGSLEPGKFADITILSDDPTSGDPAGIKDISVLGTLVGGAVHLN